jgi:hypothetical protein
MTRRSIVACAALLAAGACGPDYELPPPDPSLDPAHLRVGTPLYDCSGWLSARPTDARVLVDVFFGRRSAADPADQPRQESLRSVTDLGGEVLFEFPFPAARVWIETGNVPALVDRNIASYVATVPDPTRYDWDIGVAFSHDLTQADSVRFVELGGRVMHVLIYIRALEGYLPSRSVPTFRATEGVAYVEARGLGRLEKN